MALVIGREGGAIVELGGDLGATDHFCGAESQKCHKIHTVTESSSGFQKNWTRVISLQLEEHYVGGNQNW